MARNDNLQFYGNTVQKDYGIGTLVAAGTFSVRTPLSIVHAGFACHRSGAIGATVLQVSALSAGVVTITDLGGALNAGAIVSYVLFGSP